MKKLLGVLFALLLALPSWGDKSRVRVSLGSDYDLDSGSYIYISTSGEQGKVLAEARRVPIKVKTVGSSTTVAAATASTNPFLGVVVGDELYFNMAGLEVSRYITAKASDDSVTVDTAIDLTTDDTTGETFSWRKFAAGSAATDGWVPMAGFDTATFLVQLKQSDGGSIDVRIECENTMGPATSQVLPFAVENHTAYGCPAECDSYTIAAASQYDRCRLGMKINTDSSDAGANIEKISAQFVGTY